MFSSTPIAIGTVSIAAHVEHVILCLHVLGELIAGNTVSDLDWSGIWNRVGAVSEAEWDDLRVRLRTKYAWLTDRLEGIEDWTENDAVGLRSRFLHTRPAT